MAFAKMFQGKIPRATARFLRKYGLRPSWANIHTVHCGQHSGIPDCCILFYLTCWRRLAGDEEDGIPNGYRTLVEHLGKSQDAGYIPCPACLIAGNMVQVRRCNFPALVMAGPRELCRLCPPGCQQTEHCHPVPLP
jgi:hypothetical protein